MTETPQAPVAPVQEVPPFAPREERPYKLRDLNAGDERTVGAMIAKVTGDPRITNAVASGEQAVIVMSVVSVLLEKAAHDVALWCATLVGEDENVPPLKDYRRKEWEEAQKENRNVDFDSNIRLQRELDIIEKMDSYPSGTYLDIITDVIEAPTFERFLASSSRLGTAARKVSERFRSPSRNGSD